MTKGIVGNVFEVILGTAAVGAGAYAVYDGVTNIIGHSSDDAITASDIISADAVADVAVSED